MAAAVERIYIGGLDPDRLTVEEALDRLKSSLEDDIEVQNDHVHLGSCYCQINCVSKRDNVSALQTVVKLYNNVKWKGCRLKVQAARPNFLQRLEREIDSRRGSDADDTTSTTKTTNEQSSPETEKKKDSAAAAVIIPRHLKIRRGYGEESWKVDTKPVSVTDWRGFHKQNERLAKKRRVEHKPTRKETLLAISAARKAHWNRSIHFRFVDKGDDSRFNNNNKAEMTRYEQSASDVDDSSSTSSSSSADSSATSATSTSIEANNAKEQYVWSDDDKSNSSTESAAEQSAVSDGSNSQVSNATTSQEDNSSRRKFVWSDDDNSDSEHHEKTEVGALKASQKLKHVSENDEFAAGVRDFTTPLDSTGIDTNTAAQDSEAQAEILDQDVQANLNILGSMFPDIEGVKPVAMDGDQGEPHQESSPAGWQSGQMLRFDPTKASASQYVIPEEEDKSDSEARSATRSQSSSSEAAVSVQENPTAAHLYEEEKLEKVFREARESSNQVSSEPREGGGFSFGFDLRAEPESEKAKPSTFSFGFDLQNSVAPSSNGDTNEANRTRTDMDESRDINPQKKRRGLVFPPEELDAYYDALLKSGDGARILRDPQGYRADESVKEAWNKDRKRLTLDWKRKKKYAQSKNKFSGK